MKLLQNLYRIHSYTGFEEKMSKAIQAYLKKHDIEFDTIGLQIFNRIPDTPILIAHMDQVGTKPIKKITIVDNYITGDVNIGADDKNGIWIILKLLVDKTLKGKFSFLFTTEEEGLSVGATKLVNQMPEFFDNNKYALILDRRGKGDIIGYENYYCSKKFEDDITKEGEQFGYKPTKGAVSDADIFNEYINCVNLSVGYYNAHTDKEYTIISELKNALAFTKHIILNVKCKYEVEQFDYHWYTTYHKTGIVTSKKGTKDYTLVDVWCPSCGEDSPDCISSEYFDDGEILFCTSCGCVFDKFTGETITFSTYLQDVALSNIYEATYE